MSADEMVIFIVGVTLVFIGLVGMAFLVWVAIRSELRRRHNQNEQALSDARLQMHTHEAMSRLYEVARQAQVQRPDRDTL